LGVIENLDGMLEPLRWAHLQVDFDVPEGR
jgi:hypothetical protein